MYPIGFGDKAKNPIYHGNKQIGLLLKSLTIYNQLHHFDLLIDDESDILPCLIMGFYIYSTSFFKPGEKPIKSIKIARSITFEKELLDKYSEDFERKHG